MTTFQLFWPRPFFFVAKRWGSVFGRLPGRFYGHRRLWRSRLAPGRSTLSFLDREEDGKKLDSCGNFCAVFGTFLTGSLLLIREILPLVTLLSTFYRILCCNVLYFFLSKKREKRCRLLVKPPWFHPTLTRRVFLVAMGGVAPGTRLPALPGSSSCFLLWPTLASWCSTFLECSIPLPLWYVQNLIMCTVLFCDN